MPLRPPARAMPARGWGIVAVGVIGLATAACDEETDPVWAQFNAEDDQVTLQVGVEETVDAVSTTLHSSSGINEVGTASADPGGGPIGTEHTFVVVVLDDYESEVGRATVRLESESRGSDEYDMEPDSADEGTWTLSLVSVGDNGEVREDTVTFRLWYDASGEEGSSDDTGG